MSSEIRKDRVFGNFKNRSYRREKDKNSQNYKTRPGMDPSHLDNLRQCPCCVCFASPRSDPHHLKSGTGERGMGQRSTDKWAVPLCRHHHNEVEAAGTRREVSWFASFGVEPHELAMSLWMARGDIQRIKKLLKQPNHKEFFNYETTLRVCNFGRKTWPQSAGKKDADKIKPLAG